MAPPGPIEKEDTTAADWGTAMHSAKAGCPDDPWAHMMAPWRTELWPEKLGVHEQALSYDCRTKRVELGPTNAPIEEMNAWKDSRGPDCVTGTCDWWAELPTGEGWVDDLKTGWQVPEVLTPQLLFYSLCRSLVAEQATCRVSITHWPRRMPEPTRDGLWRQVGPVTLQAFEDELHRAWVRATGTNAGPQPGPHCRYCPSARACDRAND